jgi:hypothetical protein
LGYDLERLEKFAWDVRLFMYDLRDYLRNFKVHLKKRIVGVSAPAKGNTLLNYCEIDTTILDYITEKSPLKIGKYTPGTHIPIVPDSRLIEDQPDYAIILAHNWADQIKDSLKDFRGRWIIPNEKGLKDICCGSFRTSRQCHSPKIEGVGVHECCGVSC